MNQIQVSWAFCVCTCMEVCAHTCTVCVHVYVCVCVCLSLSVSLCLCVCVSLSVSLSVSVCLSLSFSLSLSEYVEENVMLLTVMVACCVVRSWLMVDGDALFILYSLLDTFNHCNRQQSRFKRCFFIHVFFCSLSRTHLHILHYRQIFTSWKLLSFQKSVASEHMQQSRIQMTISCKKSDSFKVTAVSNNWN